MCTIMSRTQPEPKKALHFNYMNKKQNECDCVAVGTRGGWLRVWGYHTKGGGDVLRGETGAAAGVKRFRRSLSETYVVLLPVKLQGVPLLGQLALQIGHLLLLL